MSTQTYLILQVKEDDQWVGLQGFVDRERAARNLEAARSEDPDMEYRLDDRSYETTGQR